MNVRKIYTQKISNDLLNSIILLKKSHWNFDLKSQFTWFKNNCFKKDIHFLCFIKDKLVGYGHLGVRTFFIGKKNNINNKFKYILYRTLIVNKDYRKKGIATKIEISINRYLEKIQKNAFLITKKKTINFHKKHGWLPIKKSNFQIIDHKNTLHGMIRPKMKNIMSKKFTLYYDK